MTPQPFSHPESLPLLLDQACRNRDIALLSEIWSEMAHHIETDRVKQTLAVARTCLTPQQIEWLETSLNNYVKSL